MIPENIRTCTQGALLKIPNGQRGVKNQFLKKSMNQNWNFHGDWEGGGVMCQKNPLWDWGMNIFLNSTIQEFHSPLYSASDWLMGSKKEAKCLRPL